MILSRIGFSLCLGVATIGLATSAFAQESGAETAAAPVAGPMDARLRALYEAETEWRHQEFHLVKEDNRWVQGDRFPSETAETQARRLAYWQDVLRQLDAIPLDQLSAEEQVNAAVFRQMIWEQVNSLEYKTYEAPFNSDTFFWGGLNPRTGFSSAARYRDYLGRMQDIPRYFDENIANMKAGLARGYTVPRVGIEGRDTTIEAYTVAGEDNPFYDAFRNMPDSIPAKQQAAMRKEALQIIETEV
ncbi:MAG: DUF885 family protein, partial [Sphingomonadales bacterium]|nr:DUF885 family protein [Sphingomonadales bacterium]